MSWRKRLRNLEVYVLAFAQDFRAPKREHVLLVVFTALVVASFWGLIAKEGR